MYTISSYLKVSGVGVFAGCPYLSAVIDNDDEILDATFILSESGQIDPIENLKDDKVFIFQGKVDSIVPWCK